MKLALSPFFTPEEWCACVALSTAHEKAGVEEASHANTLGKQLLYGAGEIHSRGYRFQGVDFDDGEMRFKTTEPLGANTNMIGLPPDLVTRAALRFFREHLPGAGSDIELLEESLKEQERWVHERDVSPLEEAELRVWHRKIGQKAAQFFKKLRKEYVH